MYARTIRRRLGSEKWKVEILAQEEGEESESQGIEVPQRLRAMIMREHIRKAGVTEGCPCRARLEEAMKDGHKAAERFPKSNLKRAEAPLENESATNNEKRQEIDNQADKQKSVRFEPLVTPRN